MGQWTPFIFSYSSNWKELQTLLLTLQNIARDAPAEVHGTALFCFTDNMVTYYINATGPLLPRPVNDIGPGPVWLTFSCGWVG